MKLVPLALIALAATATLPAGDATPLSPLAAPGSDAPWARELVAALPRATAVNDIDGNKIFDDLERAFLLSPGAELPVIVSFVRGISSEAGVALTKSAAPGFDEHRAFRIIPAASGSLRLDEALRVARLPEVRQIELSDEARPELETATVFMGADSVVDEMLVTGSLDGDEATASAKDINIAILDTGFDTTHKDLQGKLIHWIDLGDDKPEPYDDDGHGTHVASIAAGWGRGDAAYRGVAPGAGVVGLRITSEDDALAGYEWIAENHAQHNIRVATMSFGFGVATDGTTALERAVDATWDAGVVCFKSNGNSGPGRSTMTVPAAARGILGIGSMLDPGGSPAGVPIVGEVPVVGDAPVRVVDEGFGFRLSSFSSRGPTADGRVKPDLAAPGEAITAAANGTADEYVTFSGTSMASPFAAGTAALVIAANPALQPEDVRQILYSTAEDWGVAGADIDYGNGRIRVREAVRLAFARAQAEAPASAEPIVPFHEVRAGVVGVRPFEGAIEVNDTTHPIAATFIGEGLLLAVEVKGPGGEPVGIVGALDGPGRQHAVGFTPGEAGTYAFRVLAAPDTAFVVDFSHGTAPSLVDDVIRVLDADGIEAASLKEGNAVPAPGLALLLIALTALAFAQRRVTREK